MIINILKRWMGPCFELFVRQSHVPTVSIDRFIPMTRRMSNLEKEIYLLKAQCHTYQLN